MVLTRVLDVGAGLGGAIEYLQSLFPAVEGMAIERSVPCREYIREKLGVAVADFDIDEPWPDSLAGRFDLIILRHTLEHMLDPVAVLAKVRACLAPGGMVYLVVPNVFSLKAGKPVLTDFCRPIHLHYFVKDTLLALTAKVRLSPRVVDDAGEVWGLFDAGGNTAATPASAYEPVAAFLVSRIAAARGVDLRRICLGYVSQWLAGLRRLFRVRAGLQRANSGSAHG